MYDYLFTKSGLKYHFHRNLKEKILIDVIYVVGNLSDSAVCRLKNSVRSISSEGSRILVSDTSSDGTTQEKIKKLDFDDYYWEKCDGLFNRSRTINNAFRYMVKAENFIVMDIDVIAPPGLVRQVAKYFNSIYNMGNIIYLPEQTRSFDYKYLSRIYRRKKYFFWKIPRPPFRGPFYKSYYSGFFIVNGQRFEDVNGFDEEYVGWGAEDEDFTLRITKRNGLKRYKMEVQGFHQWHPQIFTVDKDNENALEVNRRRFSDMSKLYQQSQALVCRKGIR